MAAIVNKIVQELDGHVLTIEDPIEYLFPHSKAQVNQREVGVDTDSFASGLKSAHVKILMWWLWVNCVIQNLWVQLWYC